MLQKPAQQHTVYYYHIQYSLDTFSILRFTNCIVYAHLRDYQPYIEHHKIQTTRPLYIVQHHPKQAQNQHHCATQTKNKTMSLLLNQSKPCYTMRRGGILLPRAPNIMNRESQPKPKTNRNQKPMRSPSMLNREQNRTKQVKQVQQVQHVQQKKKTLRQ